MKHHSLINGGLLVWLWVVLVINLISALSSLLALFVAPLSAIIAIILNLGIAAGAAILIFKAQKAGFYLIIAIAVVSCIYNILSGANIIMALVSAVVMPLITYLLLRSKWDSLG